MRKFTRTLFLDLETYNECPIKDGSYKYAETVKIDVWAYAIGNNKAIAIDATDPSTPVPDELHEALLDDDCMVVMHNGGQFDRLVLKKHGYDIPAYRIWDTMVQTSLCSLPGSLDKLCDILRVSSDKAKLKDGHDLVLFFCKPTGKKAKIRRNTRLTHPEKRARYLHYAANDVEAMREVYKRLPKKNYELEHELWCLDQKINDRGFAVDMELVDAAISAVDKEMLENAAKVKEQTCGIVDKATKRTALLNYLNATYDLGIEDLTSATISQVLEKVDLHPQMRSLLLLRVSAATSSTAKYKALKRSVCSDHRLRGTLKFAGARRTWRWSGALFQPQNLPQPTIPEENIETGIEMLKLGCADLAYESIMPLTSSAIRGCIVAPPGKKLVIADLSNIEGRGGGWLAGEEWKLEAFRLFDQGLGPDIYKKSYAGMIGITPEEVDKNGRQIGKVYELASIYGGSVGAAITFSESYNLDVEWLAAQTRQPNRLIREACLKGWQWAVDKGLTYGLSKETWCALNYNTRAWRLAHPATVEYWEQLDRAWRWCLDHAGEYLQCGKVRFIYKAPWMGIELPSGGTRLYYQPQATRDSISYMGVDSLNHKWTRIQSRGSKLLENINQALSRDVMAYNMHSIDESGYEILLTVHDELVTESQDTDEYTPDILSGMMSRVPVWAEGLPLAAAGFEAYRYRK